MTKADAVKWLNNLKNDIGDARHSDLWHYAEAIDDAISVLSECEEIVHCKGCSYFEPVWGDELLGRCTQAKACFAEAQLTGASFEGASLQSASFECAIINFVSFAEADLRRANFIDAMTGGTKFATAQIDFAAFNSGIAGDCYAGELR